MSSRFGISKIIINLDFHSETFEWVDLNIVLGHWPNFTKERSRSSYDASAAVPPRKILWTPCRDEQLIQWRCGNVLMLIFVTSFDILRYADR